MRRLLDTTLAIGQVRIELLAVEIEHEKQRLFSALLLAAAALLLAAAALLLAAPALLLAGVGLVLLVGLLLLIGESSRLPVPALILLLCLGGSVVVARRAQRALSSPEGIANGSRSELSRDRDAVKDAP